ncbi:MAG: sigma-70 family RNA polymerase sigma factor, partial [Actinobacteria bacterium]|nr:sigma-70 family RNA polymerase sigma factor [Actinomycetota bacterium]
MALTDEQNAMLRLLAQGEQGYADIAALMGLSEDEVRAKVVGALAQLQAEGKPAPDVPPPIPGGAHPAAEAAPPEPEPVPEPLVEPPAAAEPEPVVADAVAPSPEKPTAAPEPSVAPAPAGPNDRKPAPGRTVTLPTGGRAWLLGAGGIAAIAIIVVVILLISGGGSSSSSTSTEASTPTAEESKAETAAEESAKPATEAKLKAVDGSEAEGFASFGRVKNKLALQVEATGLTPTTASNSYAIWLARNPQKMIPLASTAVKGTGKAAGVIAAQFEVPLEVLGYLASGTFDQIAIT